MYTGAFEMAVTHDMLYEVGPWWVLNDEVRAGLIDTPAQRRAVGYVNDPKDAGGETKFGIAKNSHPTLNITTLTWAQAEDVYYNEYWIAGKCDKMPGRIGLLHMDGCTNHGIHRANIFLQRAVKQRDDGDIGPVTIAAVNAADQIAVCMSICDQRRDFYNTLVANKPDQARFLDGWQRRIREMRAFTCQDPTRKFL